MSSAPPSGDPKPVALKDTLSLPRTDFPMKASLPQSEPARLQSWKQSGLYEQIRASRQGSPRYILHDGPPYVNGPIHLGHALNKCLKDFIVKSKTMAGFDAPYVPGFDCHGLPIEIKIDEKLGRKKLSIPPAEFLRQCREYAQKYIDLQTSQFVRLGVFGRWDAPYTTMSREYEARILETFFHFFEAGFVYRGLKPVYWCIHDQTALADAEIEYEQHSSPSIYVRYDLTSDPAALHPALAGKRVSTIIWTTTPWTLPASLAVAFHPDFDYVALEDKASDRVYIVAQALAAAGSRSLQPGIRRSHRHLQRRGSRARHLPASLPRPLHPRRARRLRHRRPGHRRRPHRPRPWRRRLLYRRALRPRPDLPRRQRRTHPRRPARIRRQDRLPGQPAHHRPRRRARRAAGPVRHLPQLSPLLALPSSRSSSAPPSSGSSTSTTRWKIDGRATTFRQRALDEIKNSVNWDPAWGEERIANMIATRPDWCISRQRIWGVPIAVFLCSALQSAADRTASSTSASSRSSRRKAWRSGTLPPPTLCCPTARTARTAAAPTFAARPTSSTSGSTPAPAGMPSSKPSPASSRPPTSTSKAATSTAAGSTPRCSPRSASDKTTPRPSKWSAPPAGPSTSRAAPCPNPSATASIPSISPTASAPKSSASGCASVDFREDVVNSENIMQRLADNYRKLRNTFRFLLGNLAGFDPASDAVSDNELLPLDRYMLARTRELVEKVCGCRRQRRLVRRLPVPPRLSGRQRVLHRRPERLLPRRPQRPPLHLRAAKRRTPLRADGARGGSPKPLSAWSRPILTFTSDEVWQYLPAVSDRPASVHLAHFPKADELGAADPGAAGRLAQASCSSATRFSKRSKPTAKQARSARPWRPESRSQAPGSRFDLL